MTYVPAKFEVATSIGLGDAFTRKYIISLLTLTLVTYVPAKFEVAKANGSGDASTRKYII